MGDKKLILSMFVSDGEIYIYTDGENIDLLQGMAQTIKLITRETPEMTTGTILDYIENCIDRG